MDRLKWNALIPGRQKIEDTQGEGEGEKEREGSRIDRWTGITVFLSLVEWRDEGARGVRADGKEKRGLGIGTHFNAPQPRGPS